MTKFTVELNPIWPGKGQRKYHVLNSAGQVIPQQFNKLETASRYAYQLEVKAECRANRDVYLGD